MEDRARINPSTEVIFRHKKKNKKNENWEGIIDIYLCFIMAMSAIENLIATRCSDLASPPVMGAPDQTQKPRISITNLTETRKTQRQRYAFKEQEKGEKGKRGGGGRKRKMIRDTRNSQIPVPSETPLRH